MPSRVISVTSRIPDPIREPYYQYPKFIASLGALGVEPTILGMGEPWHGLISKPKIMRDWLRRGECGADVIIWSDSFDVVFSEHPDKAVQTYRNTWPELPVVYNAERGLFPRNDLLSSFPECGTPWRYLNSGLIIGRATDILRILEWMPLDDTPGDCKDPDTGRDIQPNDQGWHQFTYSAQPVPMILDSHAQLFQSYSACELDEFDLTGPKVMNRLTETCPSIHHFNGNSKDLIMGHFLEKWGLD